MLCPYCQCDIEPGEETSSCSECQTDYHEECWVENGGCAVYGCTQTPEVEARSELETPTGYWGQEKKPCPNCSEPIQAAAVRCRNCGEVFSSAKPLSSSEFQKKREEKSQQGGELKRAVAAFVVCVIPFFAPLGFILTAVYYSGNRERIGRLPSLTGALYKIGLGISGAQVGLLVILVLGYMLRAGLS